ncbi:VWA domain-containing protein [Kiritimatiellaeota bacterium B1221]|nr:VWA domain-containing protein [Kiritimatiellaeota bacterium B1221]
MKTITSLLLFLLLISNPAFTAVDDKEVRPRIEVCFVLDTTGSMSGLIQGAKDKIWSIVGDLQDAEVVPELRIGLVGYRDRGDDYVVKVHEMTGDLDAMFDTLLAFQAGGGGDRPESVNEAVRTGLKNMDWSDDPKTYRTIFLVGDAPPQTGYDEPQLKDLCKIAKKQGIIINTVLCGGDNETRKIWKDAAQTTGGNFAAIEQNGGVQVIETPFDKEIQKLNRKVNDTVILYGDRDTQAAGRQKTENAAAETVSSVSRAVWNSKFNFSKAITGSEDLVDALSEGTVDVKDLDRKQLPASLQEKTPAELQSYAAAQLKTRKALQSQILEISRKRDRFLKEEMKKNGRNEDAFDQKVRQATRAQAAAKGISYTSE